MKIELNITFICKECYPNTGISYSSLELLLKNHPTLKDYPNLIGILIEVEGGLYI